MNNNNISIGNKNKIINSNIGNKIIKEKKFNSIDTKIIWNFIIPTLIALISRGIICYLGWN